MKYNIILKILLIYIKAKNFNYKLLKYLKIKILKKFNKIIIRFKNKIIYIIKKNMIKINNFFILFEI